jgi:hypothetical protein
MPSAVTARFENAGERRHDEHEQRHNDHEGEADDGDPIRIELQGNACGACGGARHCAAS